MDDESFRAELEKETGIIEHEVSQRELDVLLSGQYDAEMPCLR